MTTKQEQLKNLFEVRNDSFVKQTESIFAELAEMLNAISEYFTEQNEIGEGRMLEWDQVARVEQHNMLVLFGAIICSPGAQVTTEAGEVVTITEELAPYFSRTIRVGLPYNLVDENKQAVKDFLKKRDDATAEERTEAVNFLRKLLSKAGDGPVDVIDAPQEGFDFDNLTEEQRKGLIVPSEGKPN